MRRRMRRLPTTHADAVLIVALLFIIAVNVVEMNLRAEEFPWPWLGALIGVIVMVLLFALGWKWTS